MGLCRGVWVGLGSFVGVNREQVIPWMAKKMNIYT